MFSDVVKRWLVYRVKNNLSNNLKTGILICVPELAVFVETIFDLYSGGINYLPYLLSFSISMAVINDFSTS